MMLEGAPCDPLVWVTRGHPGPEASLRPSIPGTDVWGGGGGGCVPRLHLGEDFLEPLNLSVAQFKPPGQGAGWEGEREEYLPWKIVSRILGIKSV